MKTKTIMILGFALATSAAFAGGNEVQLDECPVKVRDLIVQRMEGGELDEVKLINLQGRPVYVAEIEFRGDREVKIYSLADGTLLKINEEISLGQAPAAVREALLQFHGKIEDLEIEKEITNGVEKVTYRAEIDRKKAPDINVVVSPAGTILNQLVEMRD